MRTVLRFTFNDVRPKCFSAFLTSPLTMVYRWETSHFVFIWCYLRLLSEESFEQDKSLPTPHRLVIYHSCLYAKGRRTSSYIRLAIYDSVVDRKLQPPTTSFHWSNWNSINNSELRMAVCEITVSFSNVLLFTYSTINICEEKATMITLKFEDTNNIYCTYFWEV